MWAIYTGEERLVDETLRVQGEVQAGGGVVGEWVAGWLEELELRGKVTERESSSSAINHVVESKTI